MTKDLIEPRTLLELLDLEGETALTSVPGYLDLEPRARDSASSTARTLVDVYEDPDVVMATDGWDITPNVSRRASGTTASPTDSAPSPAPRHWRSPRPPTPTW